MAAFSATEAAVAWLSNLGYRTSSRVPAAMPERFVTVERVGGSATDMVDLARFAVQTWADTDADAEEMANEARGYALTEQPPEGVYSARVSAGPYQFYDNDTRKARYQFVLELACTLER